VPTDAPPLPVFQALADENRLRVVNALRDGERCVCELQASLDLAQSLLSHHLKALREAGLVRDRREGRWVHYALVPEALAAASAWFGELGADASSGAAATAHSDTDAAACGPSVP